MNREEYSIKRNILKTEYDKKVRELNKEYALSNNKISIGDIITDHIGSIKVEAICITTPFGRDNPCCLYSGTEYTKSGKPFKNGSKRKVYQFNLIKV